MDVPCGHSPHPAKATLSPHPMRGEGRVRGASGHSTIGFISEISNSSERLLGCPMDASQSLGRRQNARNYRGDSPIDSRVMTHRGPVLEVWGALDLLLRSTTRMEILSGCASFKPMILQLWQPSAALAQTCCDRCFPVAPKFPCN